MTRGIGTFQPMPPSELDPEAMIEPWSRLDRPSRELVQLARADPDGRHLEYRIVHGVGLPCRSMWCQAWLAVGPVGAPEPLPVSGFIATSLPRWQKMFQRVLPLRPLWPGFAVNTVFYAAMIWLLIPGPFVLRRVIRCRRGLCPWCAYPVGASTVCTECGAVVGESRSG
ncbi:MAG: hypothetical protein ACYTGG_00915 [Planctomycetota bacterium]